jgi:hypothetical protein
VSGKAPAAVRGKAQGRIQGKTQDKTLGNTKAGPEAFVAVATRRCFIFSLEGTSWISLFPTPNRCA